MTFVGRTYLQTREPRADDVTGAALAAGRGQLLSPARPVVAVAGTWGKNILVRWPCGRLVVRPSRGLLVTPAERRAVRQSPAAARPRAPHVDPATTGDNGWPSSDLPATPRRA